MNKSSFLILVLILTGAFLRFYNLAWGAPFYFHPDERNIASSVAQLSFPHQMNPHFFAYGSLPIYVIYFTGSALQLFQKSQVGFENAIIISRFYSAFFSTLIIPLVFLIGKELRGKKLGLIAAFLATTSIGFIQFAHFGTFEMWLTFFTVILFWQCIKTVEKKYYFHPFFTSIVAGILVSIKISHLAVLPLSFGAIIFQEYFHKNKKHVFYKTILGIIVIFLIYILTNTYVFLDTSSFLSSMKYESSLALGSLPVFYTQSFYNTIPVMFQFLHIYQFLLNPVLTLIFLPALIYLIYKGVKTKNKSFLLLASYFLFLFLPQAFLFAKWTRYMMPTLPFIYLVIAVAISDFPKHFKKVFSFIALTAFIFSISYFITAFAQTDTRIAANTFAEKNIPHDAKIVSEPYDLGLTTFNSFSNIKMLNFYEDSDFNFEKADYIILPSQRLIKSRLLNQNKFPKGYELYSGLINGKLGYKKIYQTPCDIFCKITYLNDPLYALEETASVFDRPTVFIYKKIL